MSRAIPPSSSGVIRSHSTSSSSRFSRNSSTNGTVPQRARSAATRPSPSSQDRYHRHYHPQQSPLSQTYSRSQSQQSRHSHDPPSTSSHAVADHHHVAGGGDSSSRRQSPKDGKNHHHPNGHQNYQPTSKGGQNYPDNMTAAAMVMHDEGAASAPTGYLHGPVAAPPVPIQPKRRTTVTTPSGQWALGKTIGAGSMGKVKLAKNMETGEQVGRDGRGQTYGETLIISMYY